MWCLKTSLIGIISIFFSLVISTMANSGEFQGNLILYPDGCQQSNSQICKLGSELRYKQDNGLVWETDKWSGNGKSGTTDGASIPQWAQWIIGDPYDPSYLKAAIVHDHYCYHENQVRTWQKTHRMFYDALRDLGVSSLKAKTMYYAVLVGGPRWNYFVPGENCGVGCVKFAPPDSFENLLRSGPSASWIKVNEGVRYGSQELQADIKKIYNLISKDQSITADAIHKLALVKRPDNYPFTKERNNEVVEEPKEATFRLEAILQPNR